jgi:hypothetical protein
MPLKSSLNVVRVNLSTCLNNVELCTGNGLVRRLRSTVVKSMCDRRNCSKRMWLVLLMLTGLHLWAQGPRIRSYIFYYERHEAGVPEQKTPEEVPWKPRLPCCCIVRTAKA